MKQEGGDLYAMLVEPGQRLTCTGELLPTSTFQSTEVVDTGGFGGGASGSMLPSSGSMLPSSASRWPFGG